MGLGALHQRSSRLVNMKSKGFTLIELLVVIAIIAILSGIGINIYEDAQARGRDAKRKNDLKEIKTALELYYLNNDSYPTMEWVYSSAAGGAWIPGLDQRYIPKMPKDPTNTNGCNPRDNNCFTYGYYSGTWCGLNGQQYILAARLEAYPGSDLSQQPYLFNNGTLCSNWNDSPVNSLYVIKNP